MGPIRYSGSLSLEQEGKAGVLKGGETSMIDTNRRIVLHARILG
jgi:hypothetical protein